MGASPRVLACQSKTKKTFGGRVPVLVEQDGRRAEGDDDDDDGRCRDRREEGEEGEDPPINPDKQFQSRLDYREAGNSNPTYPETVRMFSNHNFRQPNEGFR